MARPEVERIVREVAGKYQFPDPDLLLATVHQESGFDPFAVGDSGNSRGIFQENVRGRGAGLAPEQSFDPYASTERAIREFQAIRAKNPTVDRGTWAALAQRPANPGQYASNINAWLGTRGSSPTPDRSVSVSDSDPAWYRQYMASQQGQQRASVTTSDADPAWYREAVARGLVGAAGGTSASRGGVDGGGYAGPPQTEEIWPVAGQKWGAVNNPFGAGQARAAGTTVQLPSSNVGADLRGRYGDPVVAPVSGTVVEAFDAPDERDRNLNHGWGGMVLLRGDNGYHYRLSHLQPGLSARPGQRVGQGQQLGAIGLSGNTTGAHLDAEKFARPGEFVDIAAGGGPSIPSPSGGARSQGPQGSTGVDPRTLTEQPGDPAWFVNFVRGLGGR